MSSNPLCVDHFSGTIQLDQSLEQNLWKTLTWHCCICCNPANGRVGFEEWLAYKIQLHGIDWIVSLPDDWDQSPKEHKKLNSDIIKFNSCHTVMLSTFFKTFNLKRIFFYLKQAGRGNRFDQIPLDQKKKYWLLARTNLET